MAQLYGLNPGDKLWKPLKCRDNGDGTYTLEVDTELSIDNATLNINNLFVASSDGTVANAKYIRTDADGKIIIGSGTISLQRGTAQHYNGAANIIPATVNFAAITKSLLVHNIDNVKTLFISFDSGVNWKQIPKTAAISLEVAAASMDVKASADGASYEIVTEE